MLVRSNSLGYAFLEKLSSSEMNVVDEQLPHALDAIGGGTYTPVASVIIQLGAEWFFDRTNLTCIENTTKFGATSTVNSVSGATWTGTYTYDSSGVITLAENSIVNVNTTKFFVNNGGTVEVKSGGNIQLDTGSTLLVGGTFQTSGTVTALFYGLHLTNNFKVLNTGTAEFDCAVQFDTGNNVTFDATVALNAAVTIAAASVVTNNGKIVHGTGGHINLARIVAANANTSYSVDGSGGFTYCGNLLHYTNTLGGDIAFTFKTSGATSGAYVDISAVDGTFAGHTINIKRDDGSGIAALTDAQGFRAVRIVNDGTNWRRAYYHGE